MSCLQNHHNLECCYTAIDYELNYYLGFYESCSLTFSFFHLEPARVLSLLTKLINLFRKSIRPELLYLNMETGNIHVEELIGDGDVRKLRTWF